MQAKKKQIGLKKPTSKKKITKKFLQQTDQAINTTKQKTFATVEETFQFQDHKTSTRTTHYSSRRQCIDKMEANKLSPFSSPGCSVSPRGRKSLSPMIVKQKQRRKNKKNKKGEPVIPSKKTPTKGQKGTKQKSKSSQIKAQFQNQFLKRMNKVEEYEQKKITEVSEEEIQSSIRKHKNPIEVNLPIKHQDLSKNSKKRQIIRDMHYKIKAKYRKVYPSLQRSQIKVLSAIILIQRLWRQRKVKEMIGQFLSPRSFSLSYGDTFGRYSQPNFFHQTNQDTMKTQKSLLSLHDENPIIINKQGYFFENSSNQNENSPSFKRQSERQSVEERSSINLKDLEVSDELSEQSTENKMKDMIKYIDCYRDVTLNMKKKKKKNKPNAFNFPESLSQKCLLEKLYKKAFKSTPTKEAKIQFFPQKSQERSKQYRPSPKKHEVVELEERFYTQAQDDEEHSNLKEDNQIHKQPLKPEEQTIGNIGNVSQVVINFLIGQFSEQFQAFSKKKCLKKKKRLPGITITSNTIREYLDNFLGFVENQYSGYFLQSFSKITPNNFLKVCRVEPQEQIFDNIEEDEDDFNWEILPASAFFEYQSLYEEKVFKIKEDDKKYENFISGLIKIHNKCLADCLTELLQKSRIDSIIFPWDSTKPSTKIFTEKVVIEKTQSAKRHIEKISTKKLGRLWRKDYDLEEVNLLLDIGDEYKREGKEWNQHSQKLEIRLEVAEMIANQLFGELLTELQHLIV